MFCTITRRVSRRNFHSTVLVNQILESGRDINQKFSNQRLPHHQRVIDQPLVNHGLVVNQRFVNQPWVNRRLANQPCMNKRFMHMEPQGSVAPNSLLATLPLSGKKLIVEKLNRSRYLEAFALIKIAENNGKNIGIGEFPDLEYFEESLLFASTVLITDPVSHTLQGLVMIQPYQSSRSFRPTICNAILVVNPDLSSEASLRDLSRISCELAVKSRCDYTGCVMEVFIYCTDFVSALRKEGFLVTCVIPHAGLLSGCSGHVPSHIMYKDLSTDVVSNLILEDIQPEMMWGDELQNFRPTLAPLPSYFPVSYYMKDGEEVIIRPLTLSDLPAFYQIMLDASRRGDGYGFEEFPIAEYFYKWYVNDYHNIVVEQKSTGKIISVVNFGPSQFNRSKHSCQLICGNAILLPEFRSRKYSMDFYSILFGVGIDCGHKYMVSTTSIGNKPLIAGVSHSGGLFFGSIPKAIYFEKEGWTDVLVDYIPLDQVTKSFREQLTKSRI